MLLPRATTFYVLGEAFQWLGMSDIHVPLNLTANGIRAFSSFMFLSLSILGAMQGTMSGMRGCIIIIKALL